MSDYASVLSAAQNLSEKERAQLIEVLSYSMESDAPFSREWESEIERRAAELDAGTATTIPWSVIKNEALARIGHVKTN